MVRAYCPPEMIASSVAVESSLLILEDAAGDGRLVVQPIATSAMLQSAGSRGELGRRITTEPRPDINNLVVLDNENDLLIADTGTRRQCCYRQLGKRKPPRREISESKGILLRAAMQYSSS